MWNCNPCQRLCRSSGRQWACGGLTVVESVYEWLLEEMSGANGGPTTMDFREKGFYSSILGLPARVAVAVYNETPWRQGGGRKVIAPPILWGAPR